MTVGFHREGHICVCVYVYVYVYFFIVGLSYPIIL